MKVAKELRLIINEFEGYKRGNRFLHDEFLIPANRVDEIIADAAVDV